jgi:type VI secretion system protein ImpB
MPNDPSVAPKERVNIVYKTTTADGQSERELPFKILVLGDFTQAEDERDIEERDTVNIDKDNFDSVLKMHNLTLNLMVDSTLPGREGEKMPLRLYFTSMKDFEPDLLLQKIEPLKKLMDLRRGLKTVKKTIAISPAFGARLTAIANNDEDKARLLRELAETS